MYQNDDSDSPPHRSEYLGQSLTMPSFSHSNTLDTLDFLIDDLDMDQVWYIVGDLYVSMYQQRPLGFPAFNKSEELLGFYREQQGSQTELLLVTTAQAKLNSEVSDEDLRVLSFGKIESGESYSTNMFSRDRYDSLERMREDVLIKHWGGN